MTAPVPGCPFCAIVAQTAPATVLFSYPDALVIRPLNPVTTGHALIIPKRHVANAAESPGLTGRMFYLAALVAGTLPAANLITSIGADATQTVEHLHVHLVPRRPGDGLALPWTGQRRAEPTPN